jgi:hypothetical protein
MANRVKMEGNQNRQRHVTECGRHRLIPHRRTSDSSGAGSLAFELIPDSSVTDARAGHAVIAAVPALACSLAGGYHLTRSAGGY